MVVAFSVVLPIPIVLKTPVDDETPLMTTPEVLPKVAPNVKGLPTRFSPPPFRNTAVTPVVPVYMELPTDVAMVVEVSCPPVKTPLILPALPTPVRIKPLVVVSTVVAVVLTVPSVNVPPLRVAPPTPVVKRLVVPELMVMLPLVPPTVTVAPEVVSVEVEVVEAVVVEPEVSVVALCPWARVPTKSMTRVPSRDVEADTAFHGRRRGCDWVGSAKLMEP